MKTVQMFHGNNGNHEFWEDKDGEVLFLRNHKEKVWTAMLNFIVVCENNNKKRMVCGTLNEVKNKVEEQTEIRYSLNPKMTWKDVKGNSKMQLLPV